MIDRAQIENLIQNIEIPGISMPLAQLSYTISMSRDVEEVQVFAEGDKININLSLGFPLGPWAHDFQEKLEAALQAGFPQVSFVLQLHCTIQAHRNQLAGCSLRGVKNLIAVGSGKGGVGKSTLTANMALILQGLGARVGILDADIYGPSMPTLFPKTQDISVVDDKYLPLLAYGVQVMSIGYLTQSDQALIWRGPMLAKAFIQLLDSTRWDALDYLFIDLPPGTGDICLSLVQKIPLTGAVVVTTPQAVATADADKALQMFRKTGITVLGVVENMSHFACTHCGEHSNLFGVGGGQTLTEQHKTTLLGQIPLHQHLREQEDQLIRDLDYTQEPAGQALLQTTVKMAAQLAKRPVRE